MTNHFDITLSRLEMEMLVEALTSHKWYIDNVLEAATLRDMLKLELTTYPNITGA